jgi:RNA polymerase sigma-70 factor (ECF subfamily)
VTDADLVARARQGDAAAFGELIDRHRTSVYRAAMAALGSHADAEDAAQEAFLAAYRRLDSFRGDASFKTWLLTITWHQAINRRRSITRLWRRIVEPRHEQHRGTAESSPAPDPVDSVASTGLNPEEAALDNRLRRDILAAIRALSPKLRDALLLAQSGAYSYDEIGAMLGLATGTVKWRVSEARKVIRKTLSGRGYSDVDWQRSR